MSYYYFTLIGMGTIKKKKRAEDKCWQECWDPCALLVEMQSVAFAIENSIGILKIQLAYDPAIPLGAHI